MPYGIENNTKQEDNKTIERFINNYYYNISLVMRY